MRHYDIYDLLMYAYNLQPKFKLCAMLRIGLYRNMIRLPCLNYYKSNAIHTGHAAVPDDYNDEILT